MKTWADWPRGRRMPARVVRARLAAATMIFVISEAVRRAVPAGKSTVDGSAIIGCRNWPVTPPNSGVGYANAAGAACSVKGVTLVPGRLAKGITGPRLVAL